MASVLKYRIFFYQSPSLLSLIKERRNIFVAPLQAEVRASGIPGLLARISVFFVIDRNHDQVVSFLFLDASRAYRHLNVRCDG